jgi:hypothetical protein
VSGVSQIIWAVYIVQVGKSVDYAYLVILQAIFTQNQTRGPPKWLLQVPSQFLPIAKKEAFAGQGSHSTMCIRINFMYSCGHVNDNNFAYCAGSRTQGELCPEQDIKKKDAKQERKCDKCNDRQIRPLLLLATSL